MGNDTTLCPGDHILLNAGTPATNYLWSSGNISQIIDISTAGIYSVIVSNYQCIANDTAIISYVPPITLQQDKTLCDELTYTLDATMPNGTYLWSTGETTSSIEISTEGTYWVVANSNGCTLSDSTLITGSLGGGVIFFPNTFTPNGNGLNDYFTGYGEHITYFKLMIFNRWGEKIFETENKEKGWDGKYKGELAEQDVYVWKIEYKTLCSKDELKQRIGHVTVLR